MSQERLEEKAQRMFDIVEQCQSSGQHKKDFCHEQNIPLSKYYYWQKRYYEEVHKNDRGFVAIDTHAADREDGQMKINLPTGVSIQIPLDTSPIIIKQLLTLV
ncbi:MAG TPA: hypothetical protein VJ937_12825 [Salinivirga sp.]|uniref:IS66 family insertion sequence element accessory protein TnpA n=1 Tax=Salinivirga sp. TaxID=1970192 RepID=UPI002B4A29CA|nr:hypothetical protein [Salinivirga sp.]HKK60356.1 hypothetical protein [Salinivirga sp.]